MNGRQGGASALAHKVPTISAPAEQVPRGLLLPCEPDFPDYFRRAVGYVDKILKGAKPGDLPIERPTCFKLSSTSRPPQPSASPSRPRWWPRLMKSSSESAGLLELGTTRM